MTLQEIAEILDVSRKTILNDMIKIKSYINKYSVNIDSKSHYGIKLSRNEIRVRKLFKDVIVRVHQLNKAIP